MSMDNRSQRIDWLLFVALGFFWGSSYLFIKIGVEHGLQPFTLVMLRLLIGTLLLATVVVAAREPLPRDPRKYGHLIVLGFFSVALPFSLITVAEQHVDSALGATLTAPVPLFTVVFAAILLHEKITLAKVIGVAIGIVGVAILMGFDPAQIGKTDLSPQLVLVGAALSYGFGGVYARRFVHGLRPMIPALFQVFFAFVMAAGAAFLTEHPLDEVGQLPVEAIFAVVWLGLLGSGLAYLVFFRLLMRWGPTRTSTGRVHAARVGHRARRDRARRGHPAGAGAGHCAGHRRHSAGEPPAQEPGRPFGAAWRANNRTSSH